MVKALKMTLQSLVDSRTRSNAREQRKQRDRERRSGVDAEVEEEKEEEITDANVVDEIASEHLATPPPTSPSSSSSSSSPTLSQQDKKEKKRKERPLTPIEALRQRQREIQSPPPSSSGANPIVPTETAVPSTPTPAPSSSSSHKPPPFPTLASYLTKHTLPQLHSPLTKPKRSQPIATPATVSSSLVTEPESTSDAAGASSATTSTSSSSSSSSSSESASLQSPSIAWGPPSDATRATRRQARDRDIQVGIREPTNDTTERHRLGKIPLAARLAGLPSVKMIRDVVRKSTKTKGSD